MNDNDMTSFYAAKKALRKAVQSKIAEVSTIPSQSEQVTQLVLGSKVFKEAKSISVFLSMEGREISTRKIVSEALKASTSVFVPYLPKSTSKRSPGSPIPFDEDMKMLQIHDGEADTLPLDKWGIPTIGPCSADGKQREDALTSPVPLSLIIMPGVAFSHSETTIKRIGYGAGYYDRYIQRYRARCRSEGIPEPKLFGVALSEQILDEDLIPTNEEDEPLDGLFIGRNLRQLAEEAA